MELYRYNVRKEERTFTNFVLTWEYNNKVFKMYVRPSFFKDMKIIKARATKVSSYEECK